jgi:hypothetical protein
MDVEAGRPGDAAIAGCIGKKTWTGTVWNTVTKRMHASFFSFYGAKLHMVRDDVQQLPEARV